MSKFEELNLNHTVDADVSEKPGKRTRTTASRQRHKPGALLVLVLPAVGGAPSLQRTCSTGCPVVRLARGTFFFLL